jgi:transposase
VAAQRSSAHFVNEVVENLDLSAIYDSYDELRGNPPYDPRMMVKIWIYAFMKGIRSSRKIETALYDDVGFRYLSANQQPDHWTISQFRKRHQKGLDSLFEQTVKMAQRARLVKLPHVAIDGTKIRVNASKHSAMSYDS